MKVNIDKREIGQRIKTLRYEKHMTLEQFGELFKAHKSIVSKWERGLTSPNSMRCYLITKEFGVNINWLLYGEGEKNERSSMDKT
ncbi:Xre family transcriptional regulator [Staphylococcus xylosus]|uniref:helix-turn-helix domain-containing protein n=1 Tax=Staphylococcus xylosus TaxID=1288 RepID=UPI00085BFB6C|nr:helix-turn-helix transcriptional regulator [Staphylococcus xylosus]SCU31464.1 Xre family transcriptional regulator [Staphylococcus xylosus]